MELPKNSLDLLNGLVKGAIQGAEEPIAIDYKGRRFNYKTRIRIHSFEEPIKTDVTATDEETGTSVRVHHAGPKDKAIRMAEEKLYDKLTELGHIKKSTELSYSDMDIHELVGRGTYGEVYRVSLKRPFRGHTQAAAKNLRKLIEKEIHILKTVQHQNIVAFLAFIEERMMSIIVTELANESLRVRLNKDRGHISRALQDKWIRESAEAIKYLHNGIPDESGICKPVVHRDLKGDNCLLFDGDVLKLCDFGIARETDHTTGTTSGKGTEAWKAPELFMPSGRVFSIATDIYAYGVLVWEITTQELPQPRQDANGARLWGQPMSSIRHSFPGYVENLLPRCWKEGRHDRPTIEKIISELPPESGVASVNIVTGGSDSADSVNVATGGSDSSDSVIDLK